MAVLYSVSNSTGDKLAFRVMVTTTATLELVSDVEVPQEALRLPKIREGVCGFLMPTQTEFGEEWVPSVALTDEEQPTVLVAGRTSLWKYPLQAGRWFPVWNCVPGGTRPLLNNPWDIVVDPQTGQWIVSDTGHRRVLVLASDASRIIHVANFPEGVRPGKVAVDGYRIIVSDLGGERIFSIPLPQGYEWMATYVFPPVEEAVDVNDVYIADVP
eukprot:TRINITY_DN20150_c0_g1_i2.p1 TRINITY_DN20150_c0_g1~~TRINITY_DN20150_c0_g1_i2.p1  ORF type:complete len:214 (+),score=19.58 TRINITY_DN20150_c0_g1_i2:559-1200(+)